MIFYKLDDLMWQYNVKSRELAKATGIGQSTISGIRNNKYMNVKLQTLNKLCKYFNCTLLDLVDYTPD